MARHIVEPPENVHETHEDVLKSVAERRGISVAELKRRRRMAGLSDHPDEE